jgi:hypothetical protein
LFTAANSGRFVDRDNNRIPMFSLPTLKRATLSWAVASAIPCSVLLASRFAFVMNDTSLPPLIPSDQYDWNAPPIGVE